MKNTISGRRPSLQMEFIYAQKKSTVRPSWMFLSSFLTISDAYPIFLDTKIENMIDDNTRDDHVVHVIDTHCSSYNYFVKKNTVSPQTLPRLYP